MTRRRDPASRAVLQMQVDGGLWARAMPVTPPLFVALFNSCDPAAVERHRRRAADDTP